MRAAARAEGASRDNPSPSGWETVKTGMAAGCVLGSPIPYALETDWPVEAAGFEPLHREICVPRMLPELQQMRAADTSVPELHQMFEHRSRYTMGDPRQLGVACIDVDRRSCEDKPMYLARIPRGIDKRHPAALTHPYQIGAAPELVHDNVEISKIAVN